MRRLLNAGFISTVSSNRDGAARTAGHQTGMNSDPSSMRRRRRWRYGRRPLVVQHFRGRVICVPELAEETASPLRGDRGDASFATRFVMSAMTQRMFFSK
jgi:hypothetical protein